MDPKEEQRESIVADAAETVGDIAFDSALEGAFDMVVGIGESAVGLAVDVVGGVLDGI